MTDEYEPIAALRDYFISKGDGESAEACNLMMTTLDKTPHVFVISKDEAKNLAKFFLECGYISHEFHQPIHEIIDRLMEFVKRIR